MIRRKLKKSFAVIIAAIFTSGIVCTTFFKDNIVYGKTVEDIEMQERSGIPLSSYWFPEELMNWSKDKDKDFKFNVSKEPLVKREKGEKINNNQSKDGKLISLAIANTHTSSTPSIGSSKFDNYNFTYWQYIDTMVAWAGSSGEGIIVPPSADIVNAAHKNGVPVLGTVFFPPAVYGGKVQWVKDFLKKDSDGRYILADKLIEVSKYYGFDGWFINQESEGLNEEEAKEFKEMMKYLQSKKDKNMQIIYYDSMTENGGISWQNQLNDENKMYLQDGNTKVSDGMFLNFWWDERGIEDSVNNAKSLGRSPYDLFAGIDVQANGYNTNANWKAVFKNPGEAKVSLGLYCPDNTYHSSKTFDEFLKKENRFWIGSNKDPRKINAEDNWKGIANYFVEKTPVTSIPFVTNFSMGNGKGYYIDGNKIGNKDWNNRSLMDVMPTYRWIIDNDKNNLNAEINYEDAYYGGSSIKLKGSIENGGITKVKLYATDLKVESNTNIALTFKENENIGNIKLLLDVDGEDKEIQLENNNSNNKWIIGQAALGELVGKNIKNISVIINGQGDSNNYSLELGRLSVTNGKKASCSKPNNIKIEESKLKENDTKAALRLSWSNEDNNVNHYEIYKENKEGDNEFIGATEGNCYYIENINRDLNSNSTKILVKAVNKDYKSNENSTSEVDFNWPQLKKPKVDFIVSTVVAAPGEEITLKSNSEAAEDLLWTIEGADEDKVKGSEVKAKFSKEGIYTVYLEGKNKAGKAVEKKENLITISKDAKGGLKNLALNKNIEASGCTNENEEGKFAVDGKSTTKWCQVGPSNQWITIDLEEEHAIKDIKISHAEAGGEARSMNTSDFTIESSNDGENWDVFDDVKGNSKAVTISEGNYKTLRYVKLKINKSEQNPGQWAAARIYEVGVEGIDGKELKVPENAKDLSLLRDKIYKGLSLIEESNKIESAKKNYKAILNEAKNFLDKSNISKEDINNEISKIKYEEDEFLKAPEIANFNELNKSIEKGKSTISNGNVGNKDGDNKEENLNNLKENLNRANNLINNKNAIQSDVDKSREELESSIERFNNDLVLVNRDSLKNKLKEMENEVKNFKVGNNNGEYKKEDIDNFNNILNEGEKLLNTKKVSKEDIDNMVYNLNIGFTTLNNSKINNNEENTVEKEESKNIESSNNTLKKDPKTLSKSKDTKLKKTGAVIGTAILCAIGIVSIVGGTIILKKKKND